MHEKTLIDEDKELFQKALDALKENDLAEFTELIKYASSRRIELSTLVDDNGNTLMHHFISAASPAFIRVARNDYFDSFNPSWHIKNKDGHTPFDLLADLPPEKKAFKDRAEITYGFWTQIYILSQFRQYLEFKKSDAGYSAQECERIINRLENGHCNGFSATWLLLWLNENEHEYYKLVGPIVGWNRERASLDTTLTKQFEHTISVIRSNQQGSALEDERDMHEKQFTHWVEHESTEDKHRDFLMGELNFFKSQESWDRFSEQNKYTADYRWESNNFTLDALMILLEKLGTNSDNKLGLHIGNNVHSTAAGIKDSKMYFFDSNYCPVSNSTDEVPLSRPYDLTSEADRKKAAEDIYFALYSRPAESLSNTFSLSILTISLKNNPYKGEQISMSDLGLSRAKNLRQG